MDRYREITLVVPQDVAEMLDRAHDEALAFISQRGEPYVSFSDFVLALLMRGIQSTGHDLQEAMRQDREAACHGCWAASNRHLLAPSADVLHTCRGGPISGERSTT